MEYIEQHKQRLNHMPWLYWTLKKKHLVWAEPWQLAIQDKLVHLETVKIAGRVFVAESAQIFAEPRRSVTLNNGVTIAAHCFVHGPVHFGEHVSLNPWCHIDAGSAGIVIGANSRIGAHTSIYGFNHGKDARALIRLQKVTSLGVRIGTDVWIGARVCIRDGVCIGDHAVVGMGAVVTRNVEPYSIVAGNPAKPIGTRSSK